jgi:DNA-binding CsgD family transcriptional regulator/PAS domain-containing protein
MSSPEGRVLSLVELIYRAASTPDEWNDFAAALAAELGDPAVALNLEVPGVPATRRAYRVNSDPSYANVFSEYVARGEFPWRLDKISRDRFVYGSEIFPDSEIEGTSFYRSYMRPQRMLPVGPVGHVFGSSDGQPMAAMGIYRFDGGRPFDAADLRMLDLTVPHLRQAYRIHCELQGYRNQMDATREVLDRVPIGVVLLDRDCRATAINEVAERIAAQNDGFAIDGGPQLVQNVEVGGIETTAPAGSAAKVRSTSNIEFQRLLARAVAHELRDGEGGFFAERPSGKRAFTGVVTSLSATARIGFAQDARAALYISDPESHNLGMRNLLASLYGLTDAEAEIATLLSAGHSIEEAAEVRGVKLSTARSQLKSVFAKTGVNRQSDLLRLLLNNVTALLLSREG